MTIVDTATGEVVEIADAEEALELAIKVDVAFANMNVHTGHAIEAMIDAYKRRAWIGLGLGSWEELAAARNWIWKPLTSADRAAFGEVLRNNGFSLRAIAKVAGSSKDTIRRDLAGVSNETPGPDLTCSESNTPEPIVGQDGKSYQPTRPAPADPEVVAPEPSPAPPAAARSVEDADEMAGPSESSAGTDGPAPTDTIDALRDPIDEAQVELAYELAAAAKLQRKFPADRAAEIADHELLETIADHGKRTAEWVDTIMKARRGLRSIQGGRA